MTIIMPLLSSSNIITYLGIAITHALYLFIYLIFTRPNALVRAGKGGERYKVALEWGRGVWIGKGWGKGLRSD